MDLLHVFYLLGAGLTGSRFCCSVIWPSRYGGTWKEELTAIAMFGLLWLGGILIAAVLGNLFLNVHVIADFASWRPFESSLLGWINSIQLGVVLLAIALLFYFMAMHDEHYTIINPWMDVFVICVFFAILFVAALLVLWLADLALIHFF